MRIVTLKWGDKFGPDYVNILFDGIRRNSNHEAEYVCYTDNPEGLDDYIITRPLPENLTGWWPKLWIFSQELRGQVFFFDLDTIILGPIDHILDYQGRFAILRDFYRPDGYGSGLMSWHGDHSYIYDKWIGDGQPMPAGGDQEIVEKYVEAELWQDLFPNQIVSYKQNDCERWPPEGSKIVCFHGVPKPHEVKGSWVELMWKKGGLIQLTVENAMNYPPSKAVDQMRENCKLDVRWLTNGPVNNKTLCIVGGAPSLKRNLGALKKKITLGADVISLNGATKYLLGINVKPKYHCQFDARPENVAFLPNFDGIYLIGSMSHPDVFKAVSDKKVVMWHADICQTEQMAILNEYPYKPAMLVGGGATVGLRALIIGFIMGYRKFVVFGMDSSYEGAEHHAYEQKINDLDGRIDVYLDGVKYECAPWMYRQASEFKEFYRQLVKMGCLIKVVGDGLLPEICRRLNGTSQ